MCQTQHRWLVKAKNVLIKIVNDHLAGGESGRFLVNEVTYCSNPVCEKIFSVNGVKV